MPRTTKKKSWIKSKKSPWKGKTRTRRPNKIYTFSETFHYPTGVSITSLDIANTLAVWVNNNPVVSFQAAYMPGWSGLANNFDQYRIEEIELNFVPSYNMGDVAAFGAGTAASSVPTILFAVDLDGQPSGSGLTSEQQLLQYQNMKRLYMDRPRKVKFTPKVSMEAYNGLSITPAYALSPKGQWIDCANGSVPQYGCLWYIPGTESTPQGQTLNTGWGCRVYVKYTVSFQNPI